LGFWYKRQSLFRISFAIHFYESGSKSVAYSKKVKPFVLKTTVYSQKVYLYSKKVHLFRTIGIRTKVKEKRQRIKTN
jgi:hypothetical protein